MWPIYHQVIALNSKFTIMSNNVEEKKQIHIDISKRAKYYIDV